MNWLRNIAGRVYVVYGLLIFVATLLVMVIPIWITSLLPDPRKTRYFLALARGWMKVFMPIVFCPVYRRGKEHFKKGQVYVVVCNHNSLMDVPVTTPGVPGVNKTLAKQEMSKIPLFGMMYKIGSVMVNRKDEASRKQSIERMREALEMGMHMILFPEGTRNRTGYPLKSFYDGAFLLAIDAQVPIIPSLVFHTRKILVPGKVFFALPHHIDFHFLPPVETKGLKREDARMLKEKVFMIMWDYYQQHNRD